ncbi:MAG TPA: LytR C-terminal domain-containing protein, partial [Acidimicrobiales bacterium]|nr:LytR C-terminal domain-containing protein [Acidimicrobiales bacterium]
EPEAGTEGGAAAAAPAADAGAEGKGDAGDDPTPAEPAAVGEAVTGQIDVVEAAAEPPAPAADEDGETDETGVVAGVGDFTASVSEAPPADDESEAQAEAEAEAEAPVDEVDVSGAADVPEPPPAPRAWQVPVLRAKRNDSQPPPPDAVPGGTSTQEPSAPTPLPATDEAPTAPTPEAVAPIEPETASEAGSDTTAPEPATETPAADEPAAPDAVAAPVTAGGELGPRARRRIEAHRSRTVKLRRQRRLAVAGLVVLVTTGAALGLVGASKVRGSTGGHYIDPQVQPDEPGYVALVTPTPTLLVLHKGASGTLSGVSLLALHAQEKGGSVIVMPVTTVAPFADAGTTFAEAYADGGADSVATQVELTLNITIGETVEVDDLRWATLLDPVAPITLDLDKAVGEWSAGEAEIPADKVGEFLDARTGSETELGRLDRQELFWETWLPLVKAGGKTAVPGEVDVGLGRFVRGLAAGDTDVTSLPVSAAFSADEMYAPTEEMLPGLVAQAVPYPQEPSRGSRVQTQLLNGTTQTDLTARAATSLVTGGAEIALVGNAASFAEPTTQFVYTSSKLRDEAEQLRDAFGVGEVVQSPTDDDAAPVEDDRIDVTVILGADALDALGG